MLGEIETELTDETVGVAEKWRLRQRAELARVARVRPTYRR
jgi:hypothetical protein